MCVCNGVLLEVRSSTKEVLDEREMFKGTIRGALLGVGGPVSVVERRVKC